ncbi:MAG: hypothetical protein P1Q69_02030 [Candidatus Thorarchaeota archaeon]|nr:hypothetical protein [Candidatus Thorarchaeota archaeon]
MLREIRENDDSHEDEIKERYLTLEERDRLIKEHDAEFSIPKESDESKGESKEDETIEESVRSIISKRSLTSEERDTLLEQNKLLSFEERQTLLEEHASTFIPSASDRISLYESNENKDPTITRFLNNIDITSIDSAIRIDLPPSCGGFQIQIDCSDEWDDRAIRSNVKDILRKTLHELKLTYRKSKKGGSYYVYGQALNDVHVQDVVRERIVTTIESRHSYFKLVETALSCPLPSLLESANGTRFSDMINTPSAHTAIDTFLFALLDRQVSGLDTWQKSMGDSVSSKRENFILRALNMEISFLISILLSKRFIDNELMNRSPDDLTFASTGYSSAEVIEVSKREAADYLNSKYKEWALEPQVIREALEYSPLQKLNALGAFNYILQKDDASLALYNQKQSLFPTDTQDTAFLDFMEKACQGHRVLKKEVLKPLRDGDIDLRNALSRWWHLSNQKPESYIAFQIMKGLQEGKDRLLAAYVPNQGVWIASLNDNGNWIRVGNLGIGQGKGGQANPNDLNAFSTFRKTTAYGTPRAWYFQLDDKHEIEVKYLLMNPSVAEALFVSSNLHDAKSKVAEAKHKAALEMIFTKDRKEDSATYGETVMVSPDGIISTLVQQLFAEGKTVSKDIWISKNTDMTIEGYNSKVRGLKESNADFSDMMSFIHDVQYRQAYEITDADPILYNFTELGLPPSLMVSQMRKLRETNLIDYDLARIAKALQPRLSLSGKYTNIEPIAIELSRIWVAASELQFENLLSRIPNHSSLNIIDKMVIKTGFLRAADLFFPLRAELANTLERYQRSNKDLRTGSKTYQKKLWLIRAAQDFQKGEHSILLNKLEEFGLQEVPKHFESRISTHGFPGYMEWKKLDYIEKTRAGESLLLVETHNHSGRSNRIVVLLERQQSGALGREAGEFVNPDIEYDVQRIAHWLDRQGNTSAKEQWEQIQSLTNRAFRLEKPSGKDMNDIRKQLGYLYESLLSTFIGTPGADISKFERKSSIYFYEILRTLTCTSYATDPRARIVGEKQYLGRPNINIQGFNIEVESALTGQSSEHLFPFLVSIFSTVSESGRRIHDAWKGMLEGSPRNLMGTSYAEASKWPYDIVYFYPTKNQDIDYLPIESTSSTSFRSLSTRTVPMAVHDLLNLKYQALDEGAIKMMHFVIADEKNSTSSRRTPFSYCKGKITHVIYDHRLPAFKERDSPQVLFDRAISRSKDIHLRYLYLLESAGKQSWMDEVDEQKRGRVTCLNPEEQRLLFGEKLSPKEMAKPRMGLPKIWAPMLRRGYESIRDDITAMIDALGGLQDEDAVKIWYYFLPYLITSKS